MIADYESKKNNLDQNDYATIGTKKRNSVSSKILESPLHSIKEDAESEEGGASFTEPVKFDYVTSNDIYENYSDYVNLKNSELDRTLMDGGYNSALSSFEYLPPKFMGIDTASFGKTRIEKNEKHPFLKLKEIAMDASIDYEDRFQSVRYMVHIPYVNGDEHCIDACKSILKDETIDVTKRFYFFGNNDKYFKLNDKVVHSLHAFFYDLAIERKYPFRLTLMSARYIFSFYHQESDERNNVLDYLLTVAENENEDRYARSECADILYSYGEQEEVVYGIKILQELGYMDQDFNKRTIYSNSENVHDDTINGSVRNIVLTLYKEYLQHNKQIEDYSLESLQKIFVDDVKVNDEEKQKLHHFFFRLMTDPTRFETLTLINIFSIVLYKIKTLQPPQKEECYKRLLQEIRDSEDTCHTGYVSRLVNVLTGFVEEDKYAFKISPQEELKSAVFARINSAMAGLPTYLKEDVMSSLWSEDKTTFDEFYNMYSPEDELRKEYKDILSEDEFTKVYEKAVKNFKSI